MKKYKNSGTKTDRPNLPTERLLTLEEVQQVVSFEGISDAVDIIKPNRIADNELKKLWIELKNNIRKTRLYLYSIRRKDNSLYAD